MEKEINEIVEEFLAETYDEEPSEMERQIIRAAILRGVAFAIAKLTT